MVFKSAIAGRQNPGYQLLTQPPPLKQGNVYWFSVRLRYENLYENLVDTDRGLSYKFDRTSYKLTESRSEIAVLL